MANINAISTVDFYNVEIELAEPRVTFLQSRALMRDAMLVMSIVSRMMR